MQILQGGEISLAKISEAVAKLPVLGGKAAVTAPVPAQKKKDAKDAKVLDESSCRLCAETYNAKERCPKVRKLVAEHLAYIDLGGPYCVTGSGLICLYAFAVRVHSGSLDSLVAIAASSLQALVVNVAFIHPLQLMLFKRGSRSRTNIGAC